MPCYKPDLLYFQNEFRSDLALFVEDGKIARVEAAEEADLPIRLPGKVLLPGLVNAHSHAFQRAIRGVTEYRQPDRPEDDFWSWREKMYQAALGLSPENLERVSRMAFLEMVENGITSVGEFHYVHHQSDGTPYDDPNELAWRVLAAADTTGINPVLLRVSYQRSGYQKPANPGQARFIDQQLETTFEALERTQKAGYQVGVTPHSVRAVTKPWLVELNAYATEKELPFHIHVSEQPRELEECQAEHGVTPVELMAEIGALNPRFTGVHAIHLSASEIEHLGSAEATVCSCPTTERNLGDGIVPAVELSRAGAGFAFGSDSNCQIDLLEDARQLDYHERLRHLQRVPLAQGRDLGRKLFAHATEGGARSLRIQAGSLEPGHRADFFSLELDHPSVAGCDPESLLDTLVFGGRQGAICEVWIAGKKLVENGRHRLRRQTVEDYKMAMGSLV